MAKVTYINRSGDVHNTDIEVGMTLMQGAVYNDVPGIDAECGGACVCATCHIYIDEEWCEKVGGPNDVEAMTLEDLDTFRPSSRLACQIEVDAHLDGLVVHVVND